MENRVKSGILEIINSSATSMCSIYRKLHYSVHKSTSGDKVRISDEAERV